MPRYVFVCSGNRPGGGVGSDNSFVVVNVDNPVAPTLGTVLPLAVNSDPIRMVNSRRYAYVCAYGIDTFLVIDISNPLAPFIAGSVAILGAEDVAVLGNYAFVVGSWDRNFHSVNISDPTNPFIADTIPTTWDIHSVKVQGNYAYVGEEDGFYIFNISDPTNLVQESYTPDPGAGELAFCYDLFVEGVYAYVCGYNCFTILDCTNVGVPVVTDTFQNGVDLPAGQLNGLTGIDKVGDLVYLAVNGGFYFTVLNVANPAVIAVAGVLNIATAIPVATPRPQEVMVRNNLAYVNMGNVGGTTEHGLHIIDVANPAVMTILGALTGGGAPNFLENAIGMGLLFILPPVIQTNPATGVT